MTLNRANFNTDIKKSIYCFCRYYNNYIVEDFSSRNGRVYSLKFEYNFGLFFGKNNYGIQKLTIITLWLNRGFIVRQIR